MLLETLSTNLAKVLTQGNSTRTLFNEGAPQAVQAGPPTKALGDGSTPDGVLAMGHDGSYAPNRLLLVPYGDGLAGSSFFMRLTGWRGLLPRNNAPEPTLWLPVYLGDFACLLSNLGGPPAAVPGGFSGLPLGETEKLCEGLALTGGQLGPWYTQVNSPGPGSDLIASAVVDVLGCRFVSFDFQQGDPAGAPVAMNCLYCRC